MRKIAAQCREAIDTLNKATEMEEDYTTFAHEMTVNGNLLLGDLLYKRLVKPGAMVAQCSNSAEGGRALTKREFRKFCKTLGLPEALDGGNDWELYVTSRLSSPPPWLLIDRTA